MAEVGFFAIPKVIRNECNMTEDLTAPAPHEDERSGVVKKLYASRDLYDFSSSLAGSLLSKQGSC